MQPYTIHILLLIFRCIVAERRHGISQEENTSDWVYARGKAVNLNEEHFPYSDSNEASNREIDPVQLDSFKQITDGLMVNVSERSLLDGKAASSLYLFGEGIFSIIMGGPSPLVAGGLVGQGKIVVSGRLELFSKPSEDLVGFTTNSLMWLSGKSEKSTIVMASYTTDVVPNMTVKTNFSPQNLDSSIDIYFVNLQNMISEEDALAVIKYVENGGALLAGGYSMKWARDNKQIGDTYALNFPGNNLVRPFGVIVGERSWHKPVRMKYAPGSNILVTLGTLAKGGNVSLTESSLEALEEIAIIANSKTTSLPELQPLMTLINYTTNRLENVTNLPAYSKAAIALVKIQLLQKPAITFMAPSHETFPGKVDALVERVSKTIEVNGTYIGYPKVFGFSGAGKHLKVSTGLYAAAGDVIKVGISQELLDLIGEEKSLGVQIGCHTDKLYKKTLQELKRHPEISIFFDITEKVTLVSNPWGGLIYVLVPWGAMYPMFNVTIENAVPAPHFVLGETSVEEWRSKIRNYPGPWGQLEVRDQIKLTVSSSVFKNLDDPTPLLELYEKVMARYNYLQGFNGNFRFRAEDITLDIQLGGGWMHSGYAIKGHASQSAGLTDINKVKEGPWGLFHELGHNSQQRAYTTPEITESGCNVYAHNAFQEVLNVTNKKHTLSAQDYEISNWLLDGKKTYEGHLASLSYTLLFDTYGYEYWRKMNQYYFQHPEIAKNANKFDIFARVTTEVMQMNLCGYYEFFNYPLTNETYEVCKKYPAMPNLIIDRYEPVLNDAEHTAHCEEGWMPIGADCFFITNETKSWQAAEEFCADSGDKTHLASCMTTEQAFHLHKYLKNNNLETEYFIGLEKQVMNHVVNLDGSEISNVLPWEKNYPETDGYHCHVFRQSTVRDKPCSSLAGFICKSGPTACGPPIQCDEGWLRKDETCYWIDDDSATFTDAVSACESKNSTLLEIKDHFEYSFIVETAKYLAASGQRHGRNYWLGKDPSKSSTWLSGEYFDFDDLWCEGEDSDEAGLLRMKKQTYCWEATSPTAKNGFICKKPGLKP